MKSEVTTNKDGSTTVTFSSSETTKKTKNEIELDSDTKVKVSEVDAEQDDKKFIEVVRNKGQLAILKDTNNYICMLKTKMFEDILKKMGSNLNDEINLIAFGIYSLEEINEIRKSFIIEPPKPLFENVTKYFEVNEPELIRVKNNEVKLDDTIFVNIQEKLDFIKAEEERKRKEEEERKKKLEEENRIKMELEGKKREKAKLKLKKTREDNIREILLKKFTQYRNIIKGLKVIEEKKKAEKEKKVLRLKIKKEPKIIVDEEAKKKEEEERKRKEEEERKRKEEEEKERLLQEKLRQQKEEEERLRKEKIKLKEEKDSEDNIKPKKRKVLKKVKKLVKIPKKKIGATSIENRKPFYISGSTSVSGGGFGHFHENVTYTGCIPKSHFSNILQCECSLCHNKYNKDNIKNNKYNNINNNINENIDDDSFICENCAKKLNQYE